MAPSLIEAMEHFVPPDDFRREPSYSQAGDCLFYFFDSGESYRDRVDAVLTVYRTIESDRIIGFQIKGVSAIMEETCTYGYRFEKNDRIELRLLILVSNLVAREPDYPDNERRELYRTMVQRSAGLEIVVPAHSSR